jgi:hypothetical protein
VYDDWMNIIHKIFLFSHNEQLFLITISIIVAVFRGLMMNFSVTSSKQKTERKNHQNWMPKSKFVYIGLAVFIDARKSLNKVPFKVPEV